jgi:hypothetical protein
VPDIEQANLHWCRIIQTGELCVQVLSEEEKFSMDGYTMTYEAVIVVMTWRALPRELILSQLIGVSLHASLLVLQACFVGGGGSLSGGVVQSVALFQRGHTEGSLIINTRPRSEHGLPPS